MICIESVFGVNDNAGARTLKCLHVFGGHGRRYANLGEIVGSVSKLRNAYNQLIYKKRGTKIKRIKKKRKKEGQLNLRPYLALIVNTKRKNRRPDGVSIKFDKNKAITFSEPTKYGPAGKSTMVPNFLGNRIKGPVPIEIKKTKWLNEKYKDVFKYAKSVI